MARRGAKPKPAHLRLIDGTRNATRHGSEDDLKALAETGQVFGKLTRPDYLKGHARKAWEKWIVPAGWLDGSREAAAIAFCELWDEYRFNTRGFPASKHGQLRAYMSELGLTDERNRVLDESEEEKDPFFD